MKNTLTLAQRQFLSYFNGPVAYIVLVIVLGFVAFVVLSGIILILAAVVGIRLWWFNRKLQKATASGQRDGASVSGVIEGEYHEVIEERDDSKP